VPAQESNPVNAGKKADIVRAVLDGLGADFGRVP